MTPPPKYSMNWSPPPRNPSMDLSPPRLNHPPAGFTNYEKGLSDIYSIMG